MDENGCCWLVGSLFFESSVFVGVGSCFTSLLGDFMFSGDPFATLAPTTDRNVSSTHMQCWCFFCWGWWCWPKTPAQQKVLILFTVDEHSLLSFMCQSYSVFNFISPCALRLEIESETHETWRAKPAWFGTRKTRTRAQLKHLQGKVLAGLSAMRTGHHAWGLDSWAMKKWASGCLGYLDVFRGLYCRVTSGLH